MDQNPNHLMILLILIQLNSFKILIENFQYQLNYHSYDYFFIILYFWNLILINFKDLILFFCARNINTKHHKIFCLVPQNQLN